MTRLGLGLMVGMYNNSVSDSIEARTINELLDLPAISLDFNPPIVVPYSTVLNQQWLRRVRS